MEDRIFKQFAEVLGVDGSVDRAELIYNIFPGWDSVGHMTLVAALEVEFDCMLDIDDVLDMSSFAKAVEIMGKYA